MSTCHLVVEGETDAGFLRALLEPIFPRGVVAFEPCGGRSSAIAAATTLVVIQREPVLLVIDADVSDRKQADLQRRQLVGLVGHRPDRFRIVMAVPTLESCLFESSRFVDEYLHGEPHGAAEALVKENPKVALGFLQPRFSDGISAVLDIVRDDDALRQSLLETALLREIRQELAELTGVATH